MGPFPLLGLTLTWFIWGRNLALHITNPLPPHTSPYQLANDFGDFFYKKLERIKKRIDRIEVSQSQPIVERGSSHDVKLDSFVPMSVNDVHHLIMTSSSASCKLDPIPTWLLKRCSSDISPVITKMINLSFQDCHFPGSWKIAHVNPLLKCSGLDAEFANFRPVSNLSFVYKTTEKAAVNQLFTYCESFALLPANQSAYRKFHSTETALLRVQSDILMSMDRQEVTLLILLDLSAAFDTIDHTILLDILDNDFGIIGNAKEWIKSFLVKGSSMFLWNTRSPNRNNLIAVSHKEAALDQFFSFSMRQVCSKWSISIFQQRMLMLMILRYIYHFAHTHLPLKILQ